MRTTDVASGTPAPVPGRQFAECLAVILALATTTARVAGAQNFSDFTTTIPEEYTKACELDRSDLTVQVIAQNADVYPVTAARTPDGWLVYDRYEEQVVELDQELRRICGWGRKGPGPMEYEDPVGMGRLDAERVVVVDGSPPALIVFGPGNDGDEHRLVMNTRPRHATVVDGTPRRVHRAVADLDAGRPATTDHPAMHPR